MIDPFTFGSIVLSYALHIGHIGYTIYQNAPDTKDKDKKEIVKIEENPNPISDDIKQIGVEIQHTIELIQKSERENLNGNVVWSM
jgi:hypothetical protein